MALLDFLTSQNTTVGGTAEGSIGQSLVVGLDVAIDSLYSFNSEFNVESSAQASIAPEITTSLEVSVQSLTSVEKTFNVESTSQASLAPVFTASLEVSVQSLTSVEKTFNVDSTSQASLAPTFSALLEVNVGILGWQATTPTTVGGSAEGTIGQNLTATMNANVGLLALDAPGNTIVGGDAEGSIGQNLPAFLDVSVSTPRSINNETNVESVSQASLVDVLTAAIDVSVQSLTSVANTFNVDSPAQASLVDPIAAILDANVAILGFQTATPTVVGGDTEGSIGLDLTLGMDVNVAILGFASQSDTVVGGDTEGSIGQDITTSLDVLVQSLFSLFNQFNVESVSQASISDVLTASLDVLKDSLTSDESFNVESLSQASLAAPITTSLDVSIQSLTSVTGTFNVVSVSQASLAAPLAAFLQVNVAILGLSSQSDTVVGGNAEGAIDNPLTASEDCNTAGSGLLVKAVQLTSQLDMAVAETLTRTASLSVTIKGTETRSSDLDALIAEPYTRTADLSVTTQGTETRLSDLDVLKQGDVEKTAALDMYLGAELGATAALDMLVKALQFRFATIDVHPSPTRAFLVPLDTLVRGVFTRSASLSLIVQSTEEKSATLDMIIEARRPYSLCKLWGHLRTRFFGGTASDANFFEHFEPHPAAVINQNLGSITPGDREITFQVPNTIPTPASYDKYSLPFSAPLPVSTVGYRLLVCFELRSFGPNNTLLLGAFTGTNDPITDLANGDFVGMAIEAEKGHVEFRAWAGGNESSRSFGLGLPTDRFVNVPLLLEIETVSATAGLTDMEFRLFDRSFNLDRPLVNIPVQTSVPPATTHFAITSLGRRTVELPTAQQDMHVDLRYVDIEPGTGTLYTPEFVAPADAKLRAFHDRPPLVLSNQGTLLLTDDLAADAGYWRLSTEVPTTLTFPGDSAQLSGVVYGEPVGAVSWRDYEVSAEFRPVSSVVGTDVVGIGLYGAGDFLTGDSLIFAVTYLNTWGIVRTVGGVQTILASGAYTADTLDPTRWHRLRFSARTDAAGTTLIHAFIDEHEVYQGTTDSLTGGAPLLLNFTLVDVQFRDLLARQGVNDVFMVLSDSPSPALFTETKFDTLTVDSSDPIITVVTFTTDSPILVPGSVNPPIVKGSLNPGFSGVAMNWYATHAGTWSIRVNSTGADNGIVLRSGTYPTPFETVSTGWDFSELPQVDDVYDVTLYLIAESGKPTAKRLGEYLLP